MSNRLLTSVAAIAMLAGASAFVSAATPEIGPVTAAHAESTMSGTDAVQPAQPPATDTQSKSATPSTSDQGAMNGASGNASGGTFITMQDASDLSADNFIGQTVTDGQDKSVGDINDLIFARNGKVKAAVIGVGGFLGLGEKNVAVPLDKITMTRDQNGDMKLTTGVTRDQLKSAPEFKTIAAQNAERQDQTTTGSTPLAPANKPATTAPSTSGSGND